MPGTLFVVATPIGNLEDVTARALRTLREVALIAAEDTRRTAHLLARYAITTSTTSFHQHNEAAKAPALIERLRGGESIALVSDAGTPAVSDPGYRLVAAARAAGVRVEPIPGPSAALAALVASGYPADSFTFLGFPPIKATDRSAWVESVRTAGRTVVFFESPHRLRSTLEQLSRVLGGCRGLIARELTKIHEELVEGPISDLVKASQDMVGEFTVVLDIGRMPVNVPAAPAEDGELWREFCEMTENDGVRRRQAVTALARRHGRSPNDVYKALERGRELVK